MTVRNSRNSVAQRVSARLTTSRRDGSGALATRATSVSQHVSGCNATRGVEGPFRAPPRLLRLLRSQGGGEVQARFLVPVLFLLTVLGGERRG